jgi:hypothetical protein
VSVSWDGRLAKKGKRNKKNKKKGRRNRRNKNKGNRSRRNKKREGRAEQVEHEERRAIGTRGTRTEKHRCLKADGDLM